LSLLQKKNFSLNFVHTTNSTKKTLKKKCFFWSKISKAGCKIEKKTKKKTVKQLKQIPVLLAHRNKKREDFYSTKACRSFFRENKVKLQKNLFSQERTWY